MPSWCTNSRSGWVKLSALKRTWKTCQNDTRPEDPDDIPIGVKRARERLNLPPNDASAPVSVVHERMGRGNLPGPVSEPIQLVGARVRRDAPPRALPEEVRRGRPALSHAIRVARDEDAMKQAMEQFDELKYASGSMATKDAMFRTWCEICAARQFDPLPVSSVKLCEVSAVLRAAAYRSGYSYLLEAKQRHLRGGYPWGEEVEHTLRDCRRALGRGLGPPKKAQEVKLEWLDLLWASEGRSVQRDRDASWPYASMLAWALGIHFVLREVELGTLTLDDRCVSLNIPRKEVTLCLATSKTDPQGRGCRRTLECLSKFGELHGLECPFCVAKNLVDVQTFRTGMTQESVMACQMPLIGQQGCAANFVDKCKMIEAAKHDASRVKELVPDAETLHVEGVTGHFMRRAGCKRYARKGLSLEVIKHMSRHSSNAVEGYVEEAMEECPQARTKLAESLHVQHSLNSFSSKLKGLEIHCNKLEAAQHERKDDTKGDTNDPRLELLWDHFQPEFVVNTCTGKKHITVGCSHKIPFSLWSTVCGWKWGLSSSIARPLSRSEKDLDEHSWCDKCRASAM